MHGIDSRYSKRIKITSPEASRPIMNEMIDFKHGFWCFPHVKSRPNDDFAAKSGTMVIHLKFVHSNMIPGCEICLVLRIL